MRGHAQHLAIKDDAPDLQLCWGSVYLPGVPDSHGDFMSADEIRTMAYAFAQKMGQSGLVDVQHDNQVYPCEVVETFIVREGDPDFPVPGTWVVCVHVSDTGLWGRIKSGELNGFSMEALVYQNDTEVDVNVQPVLVGKTDEAHDHVHEFEAWFDGDAQLIGGRTSEAAGSDGVMHVHVIKRSVQTEETLGHTHRFAYAHHLVIGKEP